MIKAEEALKAFKRIDSVDTIRSVLETPQSNWGEYLKYETEIEAEYQMDCDFNTIRKFLKTPTFDEVVKAWNVVGYSKIDYKLECKEFFVSEHATLMTSLYVSMKGIELIDVYDEYLLSMEIIYAINLTIRFLEGQRNNG